jgi:uncharacterized SAM-dependent methyltransferase
MQQSDVTGAPLQGSVRVTDLGPAATDFLREAVAGLSASPPTLPSKFFYDERGSDLFREICELPEYYITRTETALLERYAGEMAASIGANAQLVGLGTGRGREDPHAAPAPRQRHRLRAGGYLEAAADRVGR